MFFFETISSKISIVFFILFTVIIHSSLDAEVSAQTVFDLQRPARQCHQFRISGFLETSFASDNQMDKISISAAVGRIAFFELQNGTKIWESELGGEIASLPLSDDVYRKNIFVATKSLKPVINSDQAKSLSPGSGHYGSTLRSISSLTGLTNWQIPIDPADKFFLYNYKDKIVFVDENGTVACFSKSDGHQIWKIFLGNQVSAEPFLSGESLIIALTNKIVTISLLNAARLSQVTAQSPVTSLSFSDNKLYWGDISGIVYAYSLNNKKKKRLWKFQSGGSISYIIFTSTGLLVASFDNFLQMISADKGKRLWKKRFSGRITLKPLVTEETTAVTALGSAELAILNLGDGKVVNQIFLEDENFLLGSPFLTEKFLVLATSKGVYTFSNSDEKGHCNLISGKEIEP